MGSCVSLSLCLHVYVVRTFIYLCMHVACVLCGVCICVHWEQSWILAYFLREVKKCKSRAKFIFRF